MPVSLLLTTSFEDSFELAKTEAQESNRYVLLGMFFKIHVLQLFLIILNELSKMTCVQLNNVTLILIEFKSNGYQSIALETGYNFAFGHVTIG